MLPLELRLEISRYLFPRHVGKNTRQKVDIRILTVNREINKEASIALFKDSDFSVGIKQSGFDKAILAFIQLAFLTSSWLERLTRLCLSVEIGEWAQTSLTSDKRDFTRIEKALYNTGDRLRPLVVLLAGPDGYTMLKHLTVHLRIDYSRFWGSTAPKQRATIILLLLEPLQRLRGVLEPHIESVVIIPPWKVDGRTHTDVSTTETYRALLKEWMNGVRETKSATVSIRSKEIARAYKEVVGLVTLVYDTREQLNLSDHIMVFSKVFTNIDQAMDPAHIAWEQEDTEILHKMKGKSALPVCESRHISHLRLAGIKDLWSERQQLVNLEMKAILSHLDTFATVSSTTSTASLVEKLNIFNDDYDASTK